MTTAGTGCGGDACTGVEVSESASLQETAQQVLEACMGVQGAPSGVLAVSRGDEWAVAVSGPADVSGNPLTPEHLIRVGSVTKTFTAALVLRLEEQGLLSLDDRVGQYVPDVPNGDRIALEHLLRMSSGLVNYTGIEAFQKDMARAWSADELLALVRSEGPRAEPGEHFEYNNSNYFLLGMVVEKVTGLGFDEALQAHLFEPSLSADAVMEGSPRFDPGRLAQGFNKDGSAVTTGIHPDNVKAAGAITLTPAAFLRFARKLDGDLLQAESLERMRAPGPAQDFFVQKFGAEEYAMGHWRIWVDGQEVFGHPGGHPSGATAWWMTEPKSGIRVLAQFNTFEGGARDTAETAMRLMLGRVP